MAQIDKSQSCLLASRYHAFTTCGGEGLRVWGVDLVCGSESRRRIMRLWFTIDAPGAEDFGH